MFDIAQHFYKLWYENDVSKNLTSEEKKKIAKRISALTLIKAIWNDRNTDYSNDFPELKKFAHTSISGLQLVTVMECIVSELTK